MFAMPVVVVMRWCVCLTWAGVPGVDVGEDRVVEVAERQTCSQAHHSAGVRYGHLVGVRHDILRGNCSLLGPLVSRTASTKTRPGNTRISLKHL